MAKPVVFPVASPALLIWGSWESVRRHFNLVILGDGYLQSQLPQFALDAKGVADRLTQLDAPFNRMRPALNIFRMDVQSTESWRAQKVLDWHRINNAKASVPGLTDAQRRQIRRHMICNIPQVNSAFNARFCRFGSARLAFGNEKLAKAVATSDARIPTVHGIIVLINSTEFYGGSGGDVAWASLDTNGLDVAIHELMHQAFKLDDEYHFDADPSEHKRHPAAEPAGLNVSTNFNPTKQPWVDLLHPTAPRPTSIAHDPPPASPPANRCSALTPAQLLLGTYGVKPGGWANSIGAFEGANYHLCGIFRPALNCNMRSFPGAFCAVCQQIVVEALGHHLFANVPPPAERPIERATHLLTFTAPGTSQSHLLLYDNATGRIVVYACDPFAVPGATPVGRQDTIAPWWNSLTAVNYRGAPHVLAIQRGTGRTAFYKIATSSNGYTLAHVWGGTPVAPPPVPFEVPGGFVRLLAVPFTHQNGLHWLEYDAASSGAVIKRINEPLQTFAVVRAEPFSGGRVGFIPFQLPTKPEVHFFSCEILTGTVSLHKFTGDTVAQVWTGVNFLPAGQTALVPLYAWDGSPFLLAHSAFSMWQRLYRVNAEGKGLEFVWRTTTDLVPFAFLPFVFSGQVAVRFYLRYRWPLLPLAQGSIAVFRHG